MPSAMSSPMLPDETTWSPSVSVAPSLRRMIEPLPYSFSMVATASSMALLLFLASSMARFLQARKRVQKSARSWLALEELYCHSVQLSTALAVAAALFIAVVALAAMAASHPPHAHHPPPPLPTPPHP